MLLDGLRGNRGQKRDADVDDRRGGEGFKPLERVLGNLLALCGELQKPDRQRKRRILEIVRNSDVRGCTISLKAMGSRT